MDERTGRGCRANPFNHGWRTARQHPEQTSMRSKLQATGERIPREEARVRVAPRARGSKQRLDCNPPQPHTYTRTNNPHTYAHTQRHTLKTQQTYRLGPDIYI